MLILLIQSFFFLSLSPSMCAMITDNNNVRQSKVIIHPLPKLPLNHKAIKDQYTKNLTARTKVQAMLNTKHIDDWDNITTLQTNGFIIKPLPKNFQLNSIPILKQYTNYLINNEKFPENATHFIELITSHPNSSLLFSDIAHTSFYSKLLMQLKTIALENKDPNLNYMLAELYYHQPNPDYNQAQAHYRKNEVSYLIEKNAHLNAFHTYLMTSQNFLTNDMNYLFNLCDNIYDHLATFDVTNPTLSYKIGLLSYNLLDYNPTIDITEKYSLISNALKHLKYAQNNDKWNKQSTQIITKLSNNIAYLMASIEKTETVLQLFIDNKKPSHNEQETIITLLPSITRFFITTNNYPLALTVITKLIKLQNIVPAKLIQLIFTITKNLTNTNNPHKKEWLKELHTCQFYNKIQAPSHYDGNTNCIIGSLLMDKEILPTSEKIIPYFIAALDSQQLSPEIVTVIQSHCVNLYCDWAATISHDHKKCLSLFDHAIDYDNSGKAQYKKAVFILNNSNNASLIKEALMLLEENIRNNYPERELSQLELAHAYLNYNSNPARIPTLKKHIACDVDKALSYLKEHNNDRKLLMCLSNILIGTCSYLSDNIKQKYINEKEALKYINILLNLDNTQDIQKKLLAKKMQILLSDTSNSTAYEQALACIKQLQKYSDKFIFIDGDLIQQHTYNLVANKNMSDNAVEWCCLTAISRIQNNTELLSKKITPAKATPQEKELFCYLLSAAEMGNLNAQLIILAYMNAIDFCDKSIKFFNEILHYSYEGLCNPKAIEKKEQRTYLVNLLRELTAEGITLAYYILCDYYKKEPEELENLMKKLFTTAIKQEYYLDDLTAHIIEKIYSSCQDTLLRYVEPYIKNPEKESIVNALATFTLGSMYHYSNKQELLTNSILYLNAANKRISNVLPHYSQYIKLLLANAYYKKALVEEKDTNTINLRLLRKSIHLGYLPAAHKLAKIYIQQQKEENNAIPIIAHDFLPLLEQNIKNNNPCDPTSVDLYQEYLLLQQVKEKSIKNVIDTFKNNNYKDMVKYPEYQGTSPLFLDGLQAYQQGNIPKALECMEDAAIKQHDSAASIILAQNYLKGEGVKKCYSISRYFLHEALSYGLITEQFYNEGFCSAVCSYIQALITQHHPRLIKRRLLAIIKAKFKQAAINQERFDKLFHDITTIENLSAHPEWTGKNNTSEINIITTLKNSIIKDSKNKETTDSLETTSEKIKQENIAIQHPNECITTALTLLMGKYNLKNNLSNLSQATLLTNAFVHGIETQQFCNQEFLEALYAYLDVLITQPEHDHLKQQLLPIISNSLTTKKINFVTFNTIFQETTGIKDTHLF